MLLDTEGDQPSTVAPLKAYSAPSVVASTVASLNDTVADLTAKLEQTKTKYRAAKAQLRHVAVGYDDVISQHADRAMHGDHAAQSTSRQGNQNNHVTCLRSLTAILTELSDIFHAHGLVTGAGQVDEVCRIELASV